MLIIRKQQMAAFRQVPLKLFEDEMLAHSKDFYPELGESLGEERLRISLKETIKRAEAHDFVTRGPIRLFIEMALLFGSSFDTDPQYPWAATIVRNGRSQMQRAEELHAKLMDFHQKMDGSDGKNFYAALHTEGEFLRRFPGLRDDDSAETIRMSIRNILPQKAAYLDDCAVNKLIRESIMTAQRKGIDHPVGRFLLLMLILLCGHGCTQDSLFPWISDALQPATNQELPESRISRLRERSLIWFNPALVESRSGEN